MTHLLPYGFTQPGRIWKLIALLSLFVLLSAVAFAVAGALKEPDSASLWQSVLCGVLAGWILAAARQPAWRAAAALVLVGLVYILLFPGGLIASLLDILSELVRLGAALLVHRGQANVDLTALLSLARDLQLAIGVILSRVAAWMLGLATGKPVFDPVASALVWDALIWSVAAWAGWVVEARRSALLAALPSILLGVGTLGYAGRLSFALYLVLGSTLFTLAVVQQGNRQQQWNETGVAYPAEKGRQIVGVALLAIAALVLLSGLLSSLSVKRIQEWLSERRKPAAQQEDHLAVSLGILSDATASPDAMAGARSPGLPRDRLIGSGPELSQRVVMTVALRDRPSLTAARQLPLYWRSYTYDIYTGQGWSSSPAGRTVVPPGQPLAFDHPAHGYLVQQDIYPVEDLAGTFYAAGEPITANVQLQAAWRSPGDLFGVQMDVHAPYEAVSTVPLADEHILRIAGQKYPDWVRQRYLSLPSSVPGRVRVLAAQLTASRSAPYDRARAIETYLRQYPYTLDVTRPSVNQDVVDYFLFDLKKGYCDYYASAMVVLARASGVPARLVVGYASGTYNLNSQRFVVTEADAHSWVEIYFPGIGWVPFEPTASRPALESAQRPLPQLAEPPLVPAEAPRPVVGFAPWGAIFGGGAALAGLLVFAWVALDGLRLGRLSARGRAAEVYRRMRRLAGQLQVASRPGDTPYEFVAALAIRLREISGQGHRQSFGLRLIRDVDKIADRIVNISFRPSPPRDLAILSDWRELAWRLRLAWLLEHWNAILARLRTPVG